MGCLWLEACATSGSSAGILPASEADGASQADTNRRGRAL